ncbi:hypothetical protein KPL70_014420 [Citrus sinensis]|uniref:uncharacterized protein LOC102620416 isoform X1 n=1 Tax=Citrus sinensis TaxID=2711 RepID=UPI00218E1327|nr:uncharacterized protein LOC102620416 isoform X1 [Citrus sinensis]KAH9686618.1 hypothetical protein KPL70_014420 [Citrus sinensis]
MEEERNSKFERGEMVWARVVYPHQWWPGAVIRQDSLGILVSFSFNNNNNNNINSKNCPRCRYFIESEVVSFEPNFKSLVLKCTNDDLLNRALKRSGKNVLSSLKERRRSDLFRPREVLGFARSAAVSSWFEVIDYLDAANAFAQFTAFRRHFFSSASEADPAALDAGDDCREFSEKGEDNMLACSTNGSNISDISPEVSLSRWGKDQLEVCSTSETERQKIQPFQDMMDIKVRGGGKGNTTLPIEPSLESPINCLGLKRQLDQSSSDFEPPLKRHNSLSFSLNRADAYLWRSNEGFKAFLSDTSILGNACSSLCELFNTMATDMSLSFTEACGHILRNITGCESDLFKSLFSGSQLDFKTQSPSAIVAQTSASSLKELDLNLLYLSLIKCTTSHCSNQKIIEISTVQNPDETVQTVDNRGTHIPSANVQQPEDCGSIMENHNALISYANDITEKLMQTPPAQSMSNSTIGIHTNDTITVTRGTWNLHSHPTADELKMMHCSSVPSKYSFKKKKKLLKPVTSSSAVNSKVGQQSEVPTLAVSRSLLMKFPKDFSLPSKEELVKKFSPFGMIDCLNTKVYFYTGSAQVVFLHQLDAMAAYQYAKRKKIAFGKADVKFWLDPLQDKRESKNLVSSLSCAAELSGFNIRSCLKKSRVLEKEGKSSSKRVRFSMET